MKETNAFERLRGASDYTFWKVRARAGLILDGYYKYVQTALSETASDDDKNKDEKALCQIIQYCGDGPPCAHRS